MGGLFGFGDDSDDERQDAGGGQTDPQVPVTTITAMDAVSRDLLNTLKAKLHQLIIKKETDWTIMSPEEAERLNTKINELKHLQSQLSKEINDNKSRKKLTERQIEDFQDIISETQSKLEEIKNQGVTEKEYVEAKEKLQKYVQDLQNKEQQKNNLTETLSALQSRIADSENNIQAKQTEIADIRNRLENKDQSAQERTTLQDALVRAQENLENQRAKRIEFAQQRDNQLNQIQTLDPQIQQLSQRVQELSSVDTSLFELQKQQKLSEIDQFKQSFKENLRNAFLRNKISTINALNETRTEREKLEAYRRNWRQDQLGNINLVEEINKLRQLEKLHQDSIDKFDQKYLKDEFLEKNLRNNPSLRRKEEELSLLQNNLFQAVQQIQERENVQNQYQQLLQQQVQLRTQLPELEKQISEIQGTEQQVLNTIRENQDRLKRTDWLQQEGIDPAVIQNNIATAEQELARLAEEKNNLSQQYQTAQTNFANTEQEIASIRRDQTINKPDLEKIIERHDLPPELERQKTEMENRLKDLKRQLQDIPMDGSPETIERAKNLTNEINEIQTSYSLTAPLNEYHDKAARIINEYGQTFFPEHQKLAMRMDEIEKKPRLEEVLKPFLGKLARDPLDDVEKYRDRLNEETIHEGLMKDHLRKYGYDKNLIDNQFSKIGAGNSAAHHFARRQHAAMTDYLVRKEKAKMNQENFQKSFQHVLADRNATTNVINNLAQAHTAQGNIDTQNLNMRRQGLQQTAADAQNLAAMNNQYGNMLNQYAQNALDRNYQHRINTNRYADQRVLQAAQIAAGAPPAMNMQYVHPHTSGVSNMGPLPDVKNALFTNFADGLNNVLVNQSTRPAAAHGGFLQKLAKGGKVNPQPEPFTPLPYTNEMLQRANYLENARQDSNADLYANMLSAWTASPRTPTMNRIGQAILKTHQNKRDDYEKHLGRVGTSTEIYGILQKQQQQQAEFLKTNNLEERRLAEQIRHNKAYEGIMSTKASGAAKEFKLNRADVKIVQDIKSRQGMINTILPKIQRAKELLKKINPGGMLPNMTDNAYILSSIPFADVGSQEDIAEFNNLAKGIADTLGSEMAGKNFGQSMVKLMRDSKVSLADPKPTIEHFFDKLEADLNHKAKVDQFITEAMAQGLHSHEALALNPELYKTYQEINPEIDKELEPQEGENEPEFSSAAVHSNALPSISPASETANLKTENKKVENKKKKKVSTLEKMDRIMNKAWG